MHLIVSPVVQYCCWKRMTYNNVCPFAKKPLNLILYDCSKKRRVNFFVHSDCQYWSAPRSALPRRLNMVYICLVSVDQKCIFRRELARCVAIPMLASATWTSARAFGQTRLSSPQFYFGGQTTTSHTQLASHTPNTQHPTPNTQQVPAPRLR